MKGKGREAARNALIMDINFERSGSNEILYGSHAGVICVI
jgi:hypothetical protein